ncbi:hypothetical protein WOLCODRAFT_66711 [Wolfiporia cocos MD-104 SS10]|uniref:Uncharacterized protein n=1 Tax=Wolfiporia cocos (strain MD-104) TaxID=742152 RepID=A0A2H3J989_WOLCO|nr:hypothetical protein WOLCODRAFT_66711 [Wolfiporia cocos MD-104 SS10]
MCITPIPRSPHSRFAAFLDSNEDGTLSPSSPSVALPPSSDDFAPPSTEEYILSGTVAPSLITPPSIDDEGLGLCLQPHSADLPLARSPSPDDDGFQFLEVQLDPASCNLEVSEFLQLRLLRRRALSAERDARRAEAQYGQQVNEAAEKLNMPAGSDTTAVAEESEMNLGSGADDCMSDDDAARAWRHKLHCAMDMRAEARRVRKREKQRSKEVGALLDLKMARGPAPGRGAMRSLAQLVANMVLRRRDTFRPLANRKPGTPTPTHVPSSLSRCVSAEDLTEWVDMMEVEDDVACDA